MRRLRYANLPPPLQWGAAIRQGYHHAIRMTLNIAPIALAALLLFLIQPLMAKAILPIHGGAAGVWTACLVFYQCGLLAGYFYAYVLSRLPFYAQAFLHILILAASVPFLPLQSPPAVEQSSSSPEFQILLDLWRAIGLPYLILACTSPLLQHWRGEHTADGKVFRWFAISNLGSLLGLLSYPFVIEPYLSLPQQQFVWTGAYALYAVLVGVALVGHAVALRSKPSKTSELHSSSDSVASAPAQPPWSGLRALLCIALAACATIVLGASTSQMSQSGVIVPFIWILPLTLYLASFILCFQFPSLAAPTPWIRLYFAACFVACALLFWGPAFSIAWQVTLYAFFVFASSMAAHAQLHAIRPSANRLTLYYLLIALGGAIGGAFTGLAAPRLFSEYWEFHLGVALTAILLAACEIIRLAPRLRHERFARNALLPAVILAPSFILCLLWVHVEAIRAEPIIERQRDFFGVVSVLDDAKSKRRLMLHGKTQHGAEPLDHAPTTKDTLYFNEDSGVAKAIAWRRAEWRGPLKIGVIGLGTGSLLVHAQPYDQFDFYEISPAVHALAQKHFSYLTTHQGKVSVTIGDGRQLLAQKLRKDDLERYDVLVIDAFAGDALPMHLLTLEALDLYQEHLAPRGVIAFQITNRYLDLAPVLAAAAQQSRRLVVVSSGAPTETADSSFTSEVRWAILLPPDLRSTRDLDLPPWARAETPVREVLPWTDDFGSLWSALR